MNISQELMDYLASKGIQYSPTEGSLVRMGNEGPVSVDSSEIYQHQQDFNAQNDAAAAAKSAAEAASQEQLRNGPHATNTGIVGNPLTTGFAPLDPNSAAPAPGAGIHNVGSVSSNPALADFVAQPTAAAKAAAGAGGGSAAAPSLTGPPAPGTMGAAYPTGGSSSLQAGVDAMQTKSDVGAVRSYADAKGHPAVTQGIADYLSGKVSLADLLASANKPGEKEAILADPLAGSKIAQDQSKNDPALSGLYGDSGLIQKSLQGMDKGTALSDEYGGLRKGQEGRLNSLYDLLNEDRNALSGRDASYGLQDSDLQAYAQGGANIGRQFAGQEQNLAQTLARRGMEPGSGATYTGYAGLQGNKMEQLANLQQQISQSRIQSAMQLAGMRSQSDLAQAQQAGGMVGQYGTLGLQAQGQGLQSGALGLQGMGLANQSELANYGKGTAAEQTGYNQLASVAGLQQGSQGIDNQYALGMGSLTNQANSLSASIAASQAALAQRQHEFDTTIANQPGLGLTLLSGLAAPAVGAVTGGIGTGVGAALGKSLAGAMAGSK